MIVQSHNIPLPRVPRHKPRTPPRARLLHLTAHTRGTHKFIEGLTEDIAQYTLYSSRDYRRSLRTLCTEVASHNSSRFAAMVACTRSLDAAAPPSKSIVIACTH